MGAKADAIAAEFEDFKRRVRDEALRAQRSQSWCDSGVNEALRRLGLPEKQEFRIPVTVTRPAPQPERLTVTINDATSLEDAYRRLRENPAEIRRLVASQIGIRGATDIQVADAPDPSAPPAVGDSRPAEGPWYTYNTENWCNAPGSTGHYRCSRPRHTDGPHVASAGHILEVWGGTPAVAVDPTAVPEVGSPCPPAGTWYEPASETGGPNQCREWSPSMTVYCTRAAGHTVTTAQPHVAAGSNSGVLQVWVAGGYPRTPFVAGRSTERPDTYSSIDDEDEDEDGED